MSRVEWTSYIDCEENILQLTLYTYNGFSVNLYLYVELVLYKKSLKCCIVFVNSNRNLFTGKDGRQGGMSDKPSQISMISL
jgi:hypothetical protein